MNSPYVALLTLRRAEEREAELALAAAVAACAAAEEELRTARAGRARWLEEHLTGVLDASVAPVLPRTVADIERSERQTQARLSDADRALEAARAALLERRRARAVVERLHQDRLTAAAAVAARRLEGELDDLARMRAEGGKIC